jgi:hypothetical protein
MKHIKSIQEFNKTDEQLFSDANRFSKLFGMASVDKPSEEISATGGTSPNYSAGSGITTKEVVGNYGNFSPGANKNSPLIMVFGGINVGGKKSGEYMYNYLGKVGNKANIFIANDHKVDGKGAYKYVKSKLSEKSINPSKKILYLFSGGYKPGMDLLKEVSASEFDLIYLVDIWMGNTTVANFYKDLAKNNRAKTKYFYSGSGAQNQGAKNSLVEFSGFSKLNGNNNHMETNNDAVTDLLGNI